MKILTWLFARNRSDITTEDCMWVSLVEASLQAGTPVLDAIEAAHVVMKEFVRMRAIRGLKEYQREKVWPRL